MNEETRPRRSADIGELAKALSAAQKEIKAPKKGHEVSFGDGAKGRNYKYADLADVIECYREPLANHGLALTQTLDWDGSVTLLVTTLMHSSGQWQDSACPIPAYGKPQEFGSHMTYLRRYSASGILGLAAEDDDDGQRAQNAKPPAAEVSADANAILDLAAEIEQRRGSSIAEIIKGASAFPGRDGKVQSFEDPTKVRSLKWLAGTRKKLEGELSRLDSAAEPGAKESAELFQ